MYRSAASVGTARIAPDIIVRMPSRALRIVSPFDPVVPCVAHRTSHTPAVRAAYQFLSEGHGAMNLAGRVRCNIAPIAKAYRRLNPFLNCAPRALGYPRTV